MANRGTELEIGMGYSPSASYTEDMRRIDGAIENRFRELTGAALQRPNDGSIDETTLHFQAWHEVHTQLLHLAGVEGGESR